MTKVITYGTYDLLHYGHIRLLERAKALGDYLIVGVTADDYDKSRGKINVQQSLMERIDAVRDTGLADEIIVEEYEGQKIDDILRYDVDIFTVGSDWKGKFDYLKSYCQVIYLPRTDGVSSSELRDRNKTLALGMVGQSQFLNKFCRESSFVNGVHISGICTTNAEALKGPLACLPLVTGSYTELLEHVDAVYLRSQPYEHAAHIRQALEMGKHVLCESPVTLDPYTYAELSCLAKEKDLILMEAIKTAYATAYERLLLLVKGGRIGDVVSVDATCTSLRDGADDTDDEWNGMYEWGPTALLPILQILGTGYKDVCFYKKTRGDDRKRDSFIKMNFVYDHAVASAKIGDGVKSEGELIVSGTKGYAYVPAPWWKTDYFELRYEDPALNNRFFYQLDGEGIRYELVAFRKAIEFAKNRNPIAGDITAAICTVMKEYETDKNVILI